MKIIKSQLREIIKEEINKLINEQSRPSTSSGEYWDQVRAPSKRKKGNAEQEAARKFLNRITSKEISDPSTNQMKPNPFYIGNARVARILDDNKHRILSASDPIQAVIGAFKHNLGKVPSEIGDTGIDLIDASEHNQ
jgi:transcription antitermination factor NusA-like protein